MDAEAETTILWPSDAKTGSWEKTLMLGKIEGGRRRGRQRMRWLDGITDSTDMSLGRPGSWWWTGRPGVLRSKGSQITGHNLATEQHQVEFKGYSQKVATLINWSLTEFIKPPKFYRCDWKQYVHYNRRYCTLVNLMLQHMRRNWRF